MYMTYATTYLQGIGNCGVVVKQGLRWEGVGMSDTVEIAKMGNVFGVAEEFPRYVGKNASSIFSL
jgi:hypothetical protein